MTTKQNREHVETIVIGGGQAGLSTGYQLSRRGRPFLILDAQARTGDAWRNRWDSLRLFSPARYDGLAGMPFPADPHYYPTKDEMADYLESYAQRFELPVRLNTRVTRLSRNGRGFLIETDGQSYSADNVVVAMANFQEPKVPPFASQLNPEIVQIHSYDYRNPEQLQPGPVLVVGAGNSGAEIAIEAVRDHPVWLSGRDVGQIPFDINGTLGRLILVTLVLRGVFHRVLTVRTPIGRRLRSQIIARGGPLIRTKRKHLIEAGVECTGRVAGVQNGLPVLDDGRVLEVTNIVWCTGFQHSFPWIDLPVQNELGPEHERGIVPEHPGLYFVGLEFLYSLSSVMVHGLERDADRIAMAIEQRVHQMASSPSEEPITVATAD